MDVYGDFAAVYDELMDTVPYKEWADILCSLIAEYGVSEPLRGSSDPLKAERNLVIDLGCGTGTMTQLLYEKGYDVMGIDNSPDMLTRAMEKRDRAGYDILYLLQDMRELELYCTAGAIVSVCDSMNYLLQEEEVLGALRLVNNYLYPGGIFVFDFNTVYKYETLIGDATIAENRDDCSFIWENYYDSGAQLNEYDLTVFVREEQGFFRKFTETHYQRGYTAERMAALVVKAGMEVAEMADADTGGAVTAETGRVRIVAKECGKKNIEKPLSGGR